SIVERLRAACPRLTFLATTHDPLCLKGLAPEEIVVLKRELRKAGDDAIYAETDIPPLTHLPVDQLLTSFLFDLDSTRDHLTGPMVTRYSVLLGKAKRNIAEQREFKKLRAALTRQLSSAITPEQRRVEEAVRHVLAEISLEAASDTLALEAEV